ncbi:deoxyhypusine synthase family protein [Candidatus Peregrinibacteria bacterium]|nr:deoxyhypusine synthase family protein [Candidatus Peregrinibacteria bacterium]
MEHLHDDPSASHAPEELHLEPLEPLDLRKCDTVSELVEGMRHCSFGARMLGEVAQTLTEMAAKGRPPTLVYAGKPDAPLVPLLQHMVQRGFFDRMQSPEEYALHSCNPCITVVGRFSEQEEDALFQKPDRAIFINAQTIARPGQVKDGHFPDVVFSDPALVLPILARTLEERIGGLRTTIPDLLTSLEQYGGLAAQIMKGAEVLRSMVEDPQCHRFLTLSGAMTIAQMGNVIDDMIAEDMVDSIASTGALMAHGLMPGMGLKHFKYDPVHDDILLARRKLNRVTDTLEPETNFDHAAEVIDAVLGGLPDGTSIGTVEFHRLIGKYLHEHYPQERGILKTAYEKNVLVFVPAFVDSELGNDVYTGNLRRHFDGRGEIDVNPRLDQQILVDIATHAQCMGIFSIGGGVPRNHIQNIAPLLEIVNARVPEAALHTRMFSYGVRIAPDEMHYGHLSGCTYSENSSWRKFHPDARTAEIQADATIVWPLLVKYVMEMHK